MIYLLFILFQLVHIVESKEIKPCIFEYKQISNTSCGIYNETNSTVTLHQQQNIFIVNYHSQFFDIDLFKENGTLFQCDLPENGYLTLFFDTSSFDDNKNESITLFSSKQIHIDLLIQMNQTLFSFQTNGKIPFQNQKSIEKEKLSFYHLLQQSGYSKTNYTLFTYFNFLYPNSTLPKKYLETITQLVDQWLDKNLSFEEKQNVVLEKLEIIEQFPSQFWCWSCPYVTDIFGSFYEGFLLWLQSLLCEKFNKSLKEGCKFILFALNNHHQRHSQTNYSSVCSWWC